MLEMIKQLLEIRPLYFIHITNRTEISSLTEIIRLSLIVSTIAYLSFAPFDNKILSELNSKIYERSTA